MPNRSVDLAYVRSLGATLPDVKVTSDSRAVALKVAQRLMACEAIHRSAEPDSLMVRIGFERREALLAQDAGTYYVTDHYRPYPAVLVRLSRIKRASLKELLMESSDFVRGK